MITIFTATYNRAYILHELYASLCNQTTFDFEWIIVDDESTDNTEEIVNNWKTKESRFKIIYIKQNHGGKHRALNKSLDLASGEFFFIVDSDDSLTINAIEMINEWSRSISKIKDIAAVSGLKVSNDGAIWGGLPHISYKYIDATNFERRKYKLTGDKAEVYKTQILRQHKFPEFNGEYFVTEDVCWLNIAYEGYKIRWFNNPIYIAEYLNDGLTNQGANAVDGHIKNYKGYCFYISECIAKKPFVDKMIHFREYHKTANILCKGLRDRSRDILVSPFVYLFYLLVGVPVGWTIRKIKKDI